MLSTVSISSLSVVVAILLVALASSSFLLPPTASRKTRAIFAWLAFDGLIHTFLEGTFVYYSLDGRTVDSSVGPAAVLWQEYARADKRWGFADPTVVALEILTVAGGAPLAFYILVLIRRSFSSSSTTLSISNSHASRHFWTIVLCVAELYGGWMTFVPEWLAGSPYLDTSNWLYLYLYLFFMNFVWVVIPVLLLVDSYYSLRARHAVSKTE